MKLFDVLTNFPFTASETMCDYLIRTNFRTFAQKNPFARENWYRIYAEKAYARNLIRAKIISFHLIHSETFQKLLF